MTLPRNRAIIHHQNIARVRATGVGVASPISINSTPQFIYTGVSDGFVPSCPYSSIPGNRNWQIETADWNLDVRLDILGFIKKLYASLKILLRNWLAGSKTVVSISRDATVGNVVHFQLPPCVTVQGIEGICSTQNKTKPGLGVSL